MTKNRKTGPDGGYSPAQLLLNWQRLDSKERVLILARMALRVQPCLFHARGVDHEILEKCATAPFIGLLFALPDATIHDTILDRARALHEELDRALHTEVNNYVYPHRRTPTKFVVSFAFLSALATLNVCILGVPSVLNSIFDLTEGQEDITHLREILGVDCFQAAALDIQKFIEMRAEVGSQHALVFLIESSLWSASIPISEQMLELSGRWRKKLSRVSPEGRLIAELYNKLLLDHNQVDDLQAILLAKPEVSKVSSSSSSKESQALNSPPQHPRLPDSDRDIGRWGKVLYQASLLNREFLPHLCRPNSSSLCEMVAQAWQLANSELPSAELADATIKRSRTSSPKATEDQPLCKIETYLRKSLAEKAQRASSPTSDFAPPEIWLAWLKNTQAEVMEQFFDAVAPIIFPFSAKPSE